MTVGDTLLVAGRQHVYDSRPMPLPPPWALDIETIIGVAITLLAVLVPMMVSRHRARRRNPAIFPSPWRPSGPGGRALRESDAA